MKISLERLFVSLVVAACLGFVAWPGLSVFVGGAALPLALVVGSVTGWISMRRLPQSVDGVFRRRPVVAIAWVVLTIVTVVQTGRLGAYMVDPSRDWWHTTRHEFWSKHMCMAAYFYAADLSRQGEENVYDAKHYPGLNPDVESRATVAHLVPDDPYQYPPQFLLLPRLAIALSDDFNSIRPVWYTVQALFFLMMMFLLARWYGGSRGAIAMWLIPLVWVSVPSILNFQYGQFHTTTIALAVAAFLIIEKRKFAIGGALLGAAVLSKGFPGILLIPLLVRRQWRAAGWTCVWMVAITGVAWMVLGSAPFEAFLTYHLPRVQSGAAFAFDEVWPDFKGWLLAGNVSPFALVRKLGELGVAWATTDVARVVHTLFSVSVLALAVAAGRVRPSRQRALAWLGLINLAAMTSPAAWGDYVPVGILWMVTFMMTGATQSRVLSMGAVAGLCFLLPGIVPIGNFPAPNVAMAMSVLGTVVFVATNVGVVVRAVKRPSPIADSPQLAPAR